MMITQEKRTLFNKATMTDVIFIEACERAGVKPTKRQANKFWRRRGRAYEALQAFKRSVINATQEKVVLG